MNPIYKPSGRAAEYAKLACNLYTGCNNGCTYCFNKLTPWFNRESYYNPKPRKDILKNLERSLATTVDAPLTDEIQLCFYCDPYPNIADDITRQALLIFEKYNTRVSILTKNGSRAERDFDILRRNNWIFGSTIHCSESLREKYEPNADSILKRFEAIEVAKEMDIYTWVSVEPVFKPLESLTIIRMLLDVVDEFRIGKINHYPELERGIDWRRFLDKAEELLEGKKYMVKRDLLVAAGR